MEFVGIFFAALIIGFIIALISVLVMKGNLKSVHFQSSAVDYVRKDSFKLTEKRDFFLYKKVDRREKPQPQQNR